MSLSINNNMSSLTAWRSLSDNDKLLGKSMQKLSTGLRINSAADDPAGLVISEKMRAQISGLKAAASNVEKATNLISTAEKSLDKVNSLLAKMRTLAVDSANSGVNDDAMIEANQAEFDEALASIDRIANNTQFGTKNLLDGSFSNQTFQVGANEGQTVSVTINSVKTSALATKGVKVNDTKAISTIDTAISTVTALRGKLGAIQADNLDVTLDSLRVSYENLQSAESSIRDTDMTAEMATYTKYQIMTQASVSMLAQANQAPQYLLRLLQ